MVEGWHRRSGGMGTTSGCAVGTQNADTDIQQGGDRYTAPDTQRKGTGGAARCAGEMCCPQSWFLA